MKEQESEPLKERFYELIDKYFSGYYMPPSEIDELDKIREEIVKNDKGNNRQR